MVNFVYNSWLDYMDKGATNWRETATTAPTGLASASDMRVLLLMTNTTAGLGVSNGGTLSENIARVGSFTTLDEFANGGVGYVAGTSGAGRLALTGQDTQIDPTGTNKRVRLFGTGPGASGAVAWTSVAASTSGRSIAALMIAFYPTGFATDADLVPVSYYDSISGGQSFPFAASGGNITMTPAASGWIVGGTVTSAGVVNFVLT